MGDLPQVRIFLGLEKISEMAEFFEEWFHIRYLLNQYSPVTRARSTIAGKGQREYRSLYAQEIRYSMPFYVNYRSVTFMGLNCSEMGNVQHSQNLLNSKNKYAHGPFGYPGDLIWKIVKKSSCSQQFKKWWKINLMKFEGLNLWLIFFS